MDKRDQLTARNFPTAQEDAAVADTVSRYSSPKSAYRLAFTDRDFLLRADLRPVRMQLELLKPELCFQFHYFGLRKMHFLMRSIALACFPGGFGTLDELFKTMTLMQTGKSRRRPVLLFGREFWSRLINFDMLIETGMISAADVNLFRHVETAEEAWSVLQGEYGFDLSDTQTGEFAVDI